MERKSIAARAAPLARAALSTRLLVGLAPFTAFAILLGLSLSMALWVAFALAFTLGLQAFLDSGTIRAFDAANTILFGALAIFSGFIPSGVTAAAIRLVAESVLLAIVLISFIRRKPFALAFAPAQGAPAPARLHIWLSFAWAAAFAVMCMTDAASVFAGLPEAASSIAGLVVLAGALTLTLRVPAMARGAQE